MFRTDDPVRDADNFLMWQESFPTPKEECVHCKEWVEADEINPETNNLCIDCQKIDFCDCGEPRHECWYCSAPKWMQRFYDFRNTWIYKMQNLAL